MTKIFTIILAILCPVFAFSQDITGLWTGTILNDSTHEQLKYEVFISKENNGYSAFSQTWFIINNETYYGIKKLKARIAKDNKIVLLDDALLDNNYPVTVNKKIKQLNVLDFMVTNGQIKMEGGFETNTTKEFKALTGLVSLVKQPLPYNSTLLPYLKEKVMGMPLVSAK